MVSQSYGESDCTRWWSCKGASCSKAVVEEIYLASFVRIAIEARPICYGSVLVSVGGSSIVGRPQTPILGANQISPNTKVHVGKQVFGLLGQDPPVRYSLPKHLSLRVLYLVTNQSSSFVLFGLGMRFIDGLCRQMPELFALGMRAQVEGAEMPKELFVEALVDCRCLNFATVRIFSWSDSAVDVLVSALQQE